MSGDTPDSHGKTRKVLFALALVYIGIVVGDGPGLIAALMLTLACCMDPYEGPVE